MKINVTKNYRLFERSPDNRALVPEKHKKLMDSMKRYGFLPEFPIVCRRNGDKHLVVWDGQHRLSIAETLGIPVYWVEASKDWDVATVNSTAKVWVLRDYAETYAAQGKKAYQEALDFMDANRLPPGLAFALLAGTTSYGNVQKVVIDGTFRVKDRKWADAVGCIYVPFTAAAPRLRNARFIEACMAVCRVEEFDAARLIHGVDRCREKLVAYATRDAYLEMLETVYNFGRSKLFPLKVSAVSEMRKRNAAPKKEKTTA